MYPQKRALLNLATSFFRAPRRSNYHFDDKYVASFSSIPGRNNNGTTRSGSEARGGSGTSDAGNAAAEGLHGGGIGDPRRGNRAFDGGDRCREDMNREEFSASDAAANYAPEMFEAGVVGAMETGLKLGEMAKQAADGVWDATRKTTESVRDSVADGGSDEGNNLKINRFEDAKNNRIDDINDINTNGSESGDERKQASDKHVEDLRRMARGYDLKD